ncbi:MAG: DUF6149 family protein [Halobacteriaceae archaeon]
MKIRQTVRHFAARKALELPVVGDAVHDRLVALHTRVFLDRAPEADREDRRAHLEAFFDGSMAMYLAALREGYTEAEAREITHVAANFDFYRHGWTEMMEFPADEVEAHYERYREFFERHGVSISTPLGAFAPAEGLPDAPATPGKLDDPDHPNAVEGYADDVYVEDAAGDIERGGQAVPGDVDVEEAPGVGE